ncbi:MAG: hypothetical protein G01um101416_639 [Microgenomates group bacterium Gr01-1014_16]|nr:MAG: hypothetical protein G01um101416_639 [Microgenomates group bacterium Gr01-1014_16]
MPPQKLGTPVGLILLLPPRFEVVGVGVRVEVGALAKLSVAEGGVKVKLETVRSTT